MPGRAVQGRASRWKEQHVAGGRKVQRAAEAAAEARGGSRRPVSDPGTGASLAFDLRLPPCRRVGPQGRGLACGWRTFPLFFRAHRLLEGTHAACRGTWTPLVLVGAPPRPVSLHFALGDHAHSPLSGLTTSICFCSAQTTFVAFWAEILSSRGSECWGVKTHLAGSCWAALPPSASPPPRSGRLCP